MPDKPKMGIALALMKRQNPMQEEQNEESLAFGDAARECFDAMKAGDYEAFKMAFRDAIRIAQNEG